MSVHTLKMCTDDADPDVIISDHCERTEIMRCGSACSHRVGGNRKRYQQSTNADQKSLETVFSIAICRQRSDKWQSKTLFLTIFELRTSIVLAFSTAAYPGDILLFILLFFGNCLPNQISGVTWYAAYSYKDDMAALVNIILLRNPCLLLSGLHFGIKKENICSLK